MDAIKVYLRDVKKYPLLTPEEELKTARKAKRGDAQARKLMIQSNLRLVINIAKKYSYFGVSLMDLIEEGNMGLMKGVSKFNPSKGYRFSTYCAWWIKQYILRAIANQAKTIRVPVYMVETLSKFKKVSEHLSQKLERRPKLNEIAKKMKISIKKAKQLNELSTKISSLDQLVGEEGNIKVIDLIEDEKTPSAIDELGNYLRQEKIKELLLKMTDKERDVLVLRYGLKDGTFRTLEQTAKFFGITRERVRQIEEAALNKMRKLTKGQEDLKEL